MKEQEYYGYCEHYATASCQFIENFNCEYWLFISCSDVGAPRMYLNSNTDADANYDGFTCAFCLRWRHRHGHHYHHHHYHWNGKLDCRIVVLELLRGSCCCYYCCVCVCCASVCVIITARLLTCYIKFLSRAMATEQSKAEQAKTSTILIIHKYLK